VSSAIVFVEEVRLGPISAPTKKKVEGASKPISSSFPPGRGKKKGSASRDILKKKKDTPLHKILKRIPKRKLFAKKKKIERNVPGEKGGRVLPQCERRKLRGKVPRILPHRQNHYLLAKRGGCR